MVLYVLNTVQDLDAYCTYTLHSSEHCSVIQYCELDREGMGGGCILQCTVYIVQFTVHYTAVQ